MQQIEAIFQDGVFKPVSPVQLAENERVRLQVELVSVSDALKWLKEMQEHQKRFVEKRGYLPDSTPDIAADRLRDV